MPSRSAKISFLLVLDVIFFLVELIVGYAVGSLALVADSFHMLNDVLSLIVALYAIKMTRSEASPRYSYGWHRAEIVAALINGVFLLALCFSIFMEAIERFFSTPEISNAKLVVIVGCLGLSQNILGLFLFHEHGHSHDEAHSRAQSPARAPSSRLEQGDHSEAQRPSTPQPIPDNTRQRKESVSSLYGHPAATRASLVMAANDMAVTTSPTTRHQKRPSQFGDVDEGAHRDMRPGDILIDIEDESGASNDGASTSAPPLEQDGPSVAKSSGAETPRRAHGGHGHSHGSMNMHALVLHVMGDALGNIGVIVTGLIIWLSEWKFKYYCDPVISLVITVIIFSSAMPLVRSASFILLQAVPPTISLTDLRETIQSVPGVLSIHELHVWQLSESKIIASVHVWVSRKKDYMRVAAEIRKVLHDYGVHSSTIQPEFHSAEDGPPEEHLITDRETHCLIPCPPDEICAPEDACCPPPRRPSSPSDQPPPLVDI